MRVPITPALLYVTTTTPTSVGVTARDQQVVPASPKFSVA